MAEHLEVTDANFENEVLKSDIPVLVDFWASWCAPCRMIAPVVDELAKDYEGKLKVGKMDVDANNETPASLGITGIPTLIIFKNGQPMEKIVGAVPKNKIVSVVESVL